ncbi:hypothetical protein [Desulfosporosinus acidiphilus]|uniref:hypothetical protein n=1 Tax=Desulfosporosinus acidiphilus TaxID=885581 RepID=UPI0011D1C17B|nr:hypothetical protein [Desulfosporosinus acidiphilus]
MFGFIDTWSIHTAEECLLSLQSGLASGCLVTRISADEDTVFARIYSSCSKQAKIIPSAQENGFSIH